MKREWNSRRHSTYIYADISHIPTALSTRRYLLSSFASGRVNCLHFKSFSSLSCLIELKKIYSTNFSSPHTLSTHSYLLVYFPHWIYSALLLEDFWSRRAGRLKEQENKLRRNLKRKFFIECGNKFLSSVYFSFPFLAADGWRRLTKGEW